MSSIGTQQVVERTALLLQSGSPSQAHDGAVWPLLVYFGLVVVIVGAMLGISYVLGERHRERQTDTPYEGGIVGTGSARLRLDVRFYLIAMFFVIFDLESVFVFAWAVAARQLGWAGFAEVSLFIGLLLAALVYLWRLGALDFTPRHLRSTADTAALEGSRR